MFALIPVAVSFLRSSNGWIFAGIAALSAFVIYTNHIKSVAAQKAVVAIVNEAKEGAAKAHEQSEKSRVAAARPGAAQRLRNDPATCPDCVKGSAGKPVQKLAASDHKAK